MGKLSSTVAVVGAGSMGGAIASGLVVSGVAEPSRVMACDPSQEKLALLGEKGIQTFDDAATMLAADPDVVVLAVKPQVLPTVVSGIADKLVDREVISIAAGVPLATLEGLLPVSRVVRVMPTFPCRCCLVPRRCALAVGRLTRTWTSHFRCSVHLARQRSCARTNWTQRVRS